MFPTSFKAVGNNIKNTKLGDFTGTITKVFKAQFDHGVFIEGTSDPEIVKGRKSQVAKQMADGKQANPTLIAIIQIEVDGEPGNFSDYIHFNTSSADSSGSRIVGHAKELVRALGETIDLNEEKDEVWATSILSPEHLVGKTVKFNQSRDNQGLNITYLV